MPLEDNLQTSVAIACRKAGGQAALARALGIPRQSTVSSWLKRGNELPAQYVLHAEKALGISRHDLRPDLYPREEGTSPPRTSAQVPSAQPSAPAAQTPLPPAGVDGPSPALDYPSGGDPLAGVAA